MANFRTHLIVAALGGAITAGLGWHAGFWSWPEMASITGLTSLGGILPDIDADQSRSIRLIFTLFAVLAVIASVIILQPLLSPSYLVATGGGVYVAVRYVASAVFKRFTIHRGIWHSLLAGLLGSFAITALSYRGFDQPAVQAWYQGAALLLGVLIHLLLDECYSIDLVGSRLKRSFGTAFKLFDYKTPATAVMMIVVMASLMPWLPPWQALFTVAHQAKTLWP
ncbi:metal-dependent hydrolase [Phytohalomonas tamaricis]|uniref:metal-dependent hydrolase n=1 Tax=Phytohalomonas tamaricis TaxID=2081032 RepID=UPI000D0B7D9A|nr:metal-dependent hydrolase [Phytohalomonas tamaricis]